MQGSLGRQRKAEEGWKAGEGGLPRGPGVPQGTGLFRQRLDGDKKKTGPGYRWAVPKYAAYYYKVLQEREKVCTVVCV